MQPMLLRKAALLISVSTLVGIVFIGCVDEPNPTVVDQINSSVRFVHAVPDAQAVDLWIDDKKVQGNIGYKANTGYLEIKAGNRFIRFTPAGQDTSQAIYRQAVNVRSLMKITAVVFGFASNSSVIGLYTQERFTYSNEAAKIHADSAQLKLINTHAEERILQDNGTSSAVVTVTPMTLSAYKTVKSGSYTFGVLGAGSVELLSFSEAVNAKTRYSYIVVGDAANPDVLRLEDDRAN